MFRREQFQKEERCGRQWCSSPTSRPTTTTYGACSRHPTIREAPSSMSVHRAEQPPTAIDILERLVQARGVGKHAFFFTSGEGIQMPNGVEEESGYVLDELGRVFSFWLGWDEGQREPVLETWEPVEIEPRWRDEPEYQRARLPLGLP